MSRSPAPPSYIRFAQPDGDGACTDASTDVSTDPREPDRLILGDNREVMATLATGSIDLIYIDPPFGTGKRRRGGVRKPHSGYRDVPGDPATFVTWLDPCLRACHRLLADHGSLFVHLDFRTVHYVKVRLDEIFGLDNLVNEIIWCYSVGGKSKRRFGRKHDTILWYARGRDYVFWPAAVAIPRKGGSHMKLVRDEDGQLVQEKRDRKTGKVYRYPLAAGKIPEDWWTDIELLNRSDSERTGWPTQKPERLLERIVKGASSPGALVADFFCGSGTTGVVAQRLGRRFLMVDRESDAVECARERLREAGENLAAQGGRPPDVRCQTWPDSTQLALPGTA